MYKKENKVPVHVIMHDAYQLLVWSLCGSGRIYGLNNNIVLGSDRITIGLNNSLHSE